MAAWLRGTGRCGRWGAGGGGGARVLRVFTFWFDRESIIPGNLGFDIGVCRLRERGRMSKSVYVRVFHDLELSRDMFFVVRSNDSFNFQLG